MHAIRPHETRPEIRHQAVGRLVFPVLLAGGVALAVAMQPRLAPSYSYEALLDPSRISITAGNLEEAARWYEEKLGFVRLGSMMREGTDHIVLGRGRNLVELHDGRGLAGPVRIESGGGPPVTVSRVPLVVSDLDEDYGILRERGVELVEAPRVSRRTETKIGKIRDPDGRIVVLRQRLARAE